MNKYTISVVCAYIGHWLWWSVYWL